MISQPLMHSATAPTSLVSLGRVGFDGLALADLMTVPAHLPHGMLVLPSGLTTEPVTAAAFPSFSAPWPGATLLR